MLKSLNILVFSLYIPFIFGEYNLAHVFTLSRHGDRSSITPYAFDGYAPHDVWPDGLGQLTQVGIEQTFLLGKWLESSYGNFVKSNYNMSTIHVRSSDIDRAIMSAQAMMAGLFYRSNSSLEKFGLHWRPVPIHTVPAVGSNCEK